MKESLAEHCRELEAATNVVHEACATSDWARAREATRRILSAGSKLHARLALLSEMASDAQFIAEVDRALGREQKGRKDAVVGDRPLPGMGEEKKGRGKKRS